MISTRIIVLDSKNTSSNYIQSGILVCDCKSKDTKASCTWASIQTSPNQYSRQVACSCSKYYSGNTCQTFIDYCSVAGNICDLYPTFNNNMTCQSLTAVSATTNLTYACVGSCASGFTKDALGICQDINECASATACPSTATCTNQIGSYTCTCQTGFEYIAGNKTCQSKY